MKPPILGRKETTEWQRAEVIGQRKQGASFVAIAADLGIGEDTARKIWHRYQQTGDITSAPRSGRPPSLDDRDRRHIQRFITSGREERRSALEDITNKLNLGVCGNTLRKAIHHLGYNHCIERKSPWLSPKQKAARLQFAKEHCNWGLEEWRRVIWTDEMGMQTGANQGRIWVWRKPEEEYFEDCCAATHISGFRKVKVWGAMRYGELSKLVVLPGREGDEKLNAEEYCAEILDKELFDFWMASMEDVGYVLVMEDGAPYHQGCATKRRSQLMENGWEGWGPGTWPSNSPDLNPIENLWHIVRDKVRKRRPRVLTKEDLVVALQEEWSKLDISMVNKLCDSMPQRLAAVIAADGGSTGY